MRRGQIFWKSILYKVGVLAITLTECAFCHSDHGRGRTTFAYTVNHEVQCKCDYDGCVSGTVHCGGGVQAQSKEKGLANNNVQSDFTGN